MDTYFNQEDGQETVISAATEPEIVESVEEKPALPELQQLPETPCVPAAQVEPTKRKKGILKKCLKFFISSLLIIALVAVCCIVTAHLVEVRWQQKLALSNQVMKQNVEVLQEQIDFLSRVNTENIQEAEETGQLTPGQVYAQNVSAVVAIASQGTTTNIYGQVSRTASSGSGFFISDDGYVVTNYHVVSGASELSVLTYDGDIHKAEIVGYDQSNDICVLKIEGENFPCVKLGKSGGLGVGDRVAAIGNPLGELTSTLTVGYVSAKDRVVTTDGSSINMLQTDAAINSGNSGGPLFNMKGEVIGITTAKYSGTSGSGATIEGIGFAIPIDDVIDMISDLKEHGYIKGSYLGVMVMDVSESAQMYGLPAGAYVDKVTEGSAAEKAGIVEQDIIVNVGGYSVGSIADLTRVLRKFKPGETTTVTVYRAGQSVDMEITLDEKPIEEQADIPAKETQPIIDPYDFFYGN